jgi:hypothetical protein
MLRGNKNSTCLEFSLVSLKILLSLLLTLFIYQYFNNLFTTLTILSFLSEFEKKRRHVKVTEYDNLKKDGHVYITKC